MLCIVATSDCVDEDDVMFSHIIGGVARPDSLYACNLTTVSPIDRRSL